MQALRSTALSLLMLVVTLSGCGPQGQFTRTIHPVLNLAERKAQQQDVKPANAAPRTRSGLPLPCLREARTRDQFCISCNEGGVDLERCYSFHGTFDEAKNCVHSQESIKCLNQKPPFALNISIKGSLEKTLVENARLWQEGLRTIVRPRLDAEAQTALERGLTVTIDLVHALVKARKPAAWLEQSYGQAPITVKKAIADLQLQKEEGRLKLQAVLNVSRSLLEASGTPPSLLSYWEALSVEGLEEPGD